MLDNKGFDLWADGYDKIVGVSDEENTYPFAGYKDVLGTIYRILKSKLATNLQVSCKLVASWTLLFIAVKLVFWNLKNAL